LTLKWAERALLLIGVALAVWAAAVMTEARFFKTLPVPHQATRSVPAEPTTPQLSATPPNAAVAPGTWLARLEAPSVRLSATVLEGSDDDTLALGAGHIPYTPPPGDLGNVGIAGHRDTTFRVVRHLKIGDPIVLTTATEVLTYRITSTMIVEPDAVSVLDPTKRPTLTLVTCYPFNFVGDAPNRYVVKAQLFDRNDR
jgi:sortase A